MKKIPKVFANKIEKKLDNNSTYYKGSSEERGIETEKKDTQSVEQKINQIFSSPRYVYRAEVEITLVDQTIVRKIIGKNSENLITIDNETIPINDILDIKFHN